MNPIKRARRANFARQTIFVALLCGLFFGAAPARAASDLVVRERAQKNDFPLFANGRAAAILHDDGDAKVVGIAADLLGQDVQRVTGVDAATAFDASRAVIIGTLEGSALVREAVASGIDVGALRGQWESYRISVVDNPLPQSHPNVKRALLIIGSDRRGAAYGTFTLSESIGVSPWYWWADVPAARHANLFIAPQTLNQGPPSVKYRGIFINDEDFGLKPWASKHFDPALGDIGPQTYAKVFELMLRLRANICWPAMHEVTTAFNGFPDNKRVADDYAIVMSASHAEPMLYNNATEWHKNVDGEWNYLTNAAQLHKVWDERLKTNGQYENVYQVGMRGIHDSPMPGGTLDEKARTLERVFADQRAILENRVGKPAAQVPQIFTPYKEVLGIYRTGLEVPDDVTIMWVDDNHGYLRQLSNARERKRTGGSGVYYHLSYWGAPEDFLWLSSVSPSLMSYELNKAYAYGADRVWVFNVGDIKPAEKELTFAMKMAWNINAGTAQMALDFPRQWAGETFGPQFAAPIGQILNEYYRLAQRGKPEHLNLVSFAPAERAQRLADYRSIAARAHAIGAQIPARFKDAYFQLVLYPIVASALQNEKFLLARDSLQLASMGDQNALKVAAQAQSAYDGIARLTDFYNNGVAGGKWRGMMDSKQNNRASFQMPPVATPEKIAQKPSPGYDMDVSQGQFESPMQFQNGALASTSPDLFRDAPGGGSATYNFELPVSGRQPLWAWVNTPTDKEDSWHLNVNGQQTVVNDQVTGPNWDWISMGEFEVKAGLNTLVISQREPHARIQNLRWGGSNPTTQQDALLQIAGADFARKTDGANAQIAKFVGLGQRSGAATILPVTAPSVAPEQASQAAAVFYTAQLPAGQRSATFRFLPTSAINAEHGLRAAVRINGGPLQILDLNAQEYTREWGDNVLRGYSQRTVSFEQTANQKTEVEVRFLDPGLVLETIEFV